MIADGSTNSGICELSTVKTSWRDRSLERIGWDFRSLSLAWVVKCY